MGFFGISVCSDWNLIIYPFYHDYANRLLCWKVDDVELYQATKDPQPR